MYEGGDWPWGFFIYRTTYESDEDWNEAIAKLDRHVHSTVRQEAIRSRKSDPEQLKDSLEAVEVVLEGYHNVIVEDRKLLDGAPPAQVRLLFKEWLKRNGHHYSGRLQWNNCLMIDDHALRSILASSGPDLDSMAWTSKQRGYVIVIDLSFPDKGGLRHEPYNVGWMILTTDGIWTIWRDEALGNDIEFLGHYPPIGRPGLIPCWDGWRHWAEDVNGQKVEGRSLDPPEDEEEEEDEDEDEEADGYTEEGGYPLHDIYEYLKKGGHI